MSDLYVWEKGKRKRIGTNARIYFKDEPDGEWRGVDTIPYFSLHGEIEMTMLKSDEELKQAIAAKHERTETAILTIMGCPR